MKITKSQLREIITEAINESFMNPGDFGASNPKQKKASPDPSMADAEKSFINSVIKNEYKVMDYREHQSLSQRLALAIENAVAAELEGFQPTPLQEEAPPGKEDMVKTLKKKMCDGKDDCPEAFATAWKSHNKK